MRRVALASLVILLPLVVAPAGLARAAPSPGNPASWRPTDAITIPAGAVVELSGRAVARSVTVRGVLRLRGPALLTLRGNLRVTGRLEARAPDPARPAIVRFTGGRLGETGLWVVGAGRLDLRGAPRTAWARLALAAGDLPRGARRLVLKRHPRGWQPGDLVSVVPTAPPTVAGFSRGFDEARVASVVGRVVTLDRGLARAHPRPRVQHLTAEVLNLTRSVRIEGTPSFFAHVIVDHGQRPQYLADVALRYVGVRGRRGRYGLHLHMLGDAARGTRVVRTVVWDAGNHAFVAHDSHGVTYRDDIAYRTLEDAYWWDQSPDTRTPGPDTHDVLYDRCVAADVRSGPIGEGYRMSGFALAQGLRNEVRDSVAVGVNGVPDNPRAISSGFLWPESFGSNGRHGIWTFSRGNVAHNIIGAGIFNWQNDDIAHVVSNFVAYRNGFYGIVQGAYGNDFAFHDVALVGNRPGQALLMASSGVNEEHPDEHQHRQQWLRVLFDGAGLSPYGIAAYDHLGGDDPVIVRDSTLRGATRGAVSLQPGEGHEPFTLDLVRPRITGRPFRFVNQIPGGAAVTPRDHVRVLPRDGPAYRVSPLSGPGEPVPGWQARRRPIARFAVPYTTEIPPEASLLAPQGGARAIAGSRLIVRGWVTDDRRVAGVRLLVDGRPAGVDRTAPYRFVWRVGAVGAHRLQLRAIDADGNRVVSRIQTVFVRS